MKLNSVQIGYQLYKFFGINTLFLFSYFSDIETLKKIVGKVMLDAEYESSYFTNLKFEGFFRGRSHNHLLGSLKNGELNEFTNEKDFKNAPAEAVKRGRCNDNGESLFYASTMLSTAIMESRPTVGQYVTIASFVGIFDGKQFEHRISPIGYRYLKQIPGLAKSMRKMDVEKRKKKFERTDDFLDNLFHIKTRRYNFHYKLSNAIAQCFFTETINQNGDRFSKHGLVYSSIIRDKKSYNLVLNPIYLNYYKIDFIQTFKILYLSNSNLKLQLLRQGFLNGEKTHPTEIFDINWQEIEKTPESIREYKL
ncbi:MAG: RES domain-containing protein [Algibacter sp.]|uniref:RES domain-containing protein n=1 Tax=Algibacter sp. TaxID=1872428 RepID=UPI003296FCDF